jgi:hypothetical protein
MNTQLVDDLKALDMINDELSHLLTKILHRYSKTELMETASALKIPDVSPKTNKWELLKHILCHVSDDSWLISN